MRVVENKNHEKTYFVSTLITLIIVLMLVFSGPVSAIQVALNTQDLDNRKVGETGVFYVNVTIGANERIPVANISVEGLPDIPGSPDGKLIFNASDFNNTGESVVMGSYTITLIDRYGWVEGYGYGSGYIDNYGYAPYYGYGYGYSFYGYGYGYGNGHGYGYGNGYGYGYGYGESDAGTYTQLKYKISVNTAGAAAGTYNAV